MEDIHELLQKHRELKGEVRFVEQQLADALMSYKGTIADALKEGLVRANFPTPRGFKGWLRSQK